MSDEGSPQPRALPVLPLDMSLDPTATLTLSPLQGSPSRTELASRCHRRHLLSDHLRRSRTLSPHLYFGGRIHDGVYTWWQELEVKGTSAAAAYQAALEAALSGWAGPQGSYMTEDLARQIMVAYTEGAQLSAGLPGRWQLVEAERRAKVAYGPYHLSFQTDRLLESLDEPGLYAVVDTKTTGWTWPKWRDAMSRSLQQKLYQMALRRLYGYDVKHTVCEGIGKRSHRGMKQGEIVYHWASLGWTESMLEEAWQRWVSVMEQDSAWVAASYERAGLSGVRSPSELSDAERAALYTAAAEIALTEAAYNPHDCESFGQTCEYAQLCDNAPEDRLESFFGDFELREPWDGTGEDA